MKKIYFASPLFDEASRDWNKKVVAVIREKYDVQIYLPQENSEINDKSDDSAEVTSLDIFNLDTKELVASDILIANLDGGLEIDSGVACEVGYFAALCDQTPSKKIVGLISDVRWNATNGAVGEQHGVYKNLYVIGAVKKYGMLIENDHQNYTNKIIKSLELILDKK
ncbi:MAG: nucleoside 2-deoxyribosyltransferase [Anaerorhabdus sp.]